MRLACAIALLAWVASTTVTTSVARADDAQEDPKRAEAARLFNLGRIAFREARYDEAILRWQESHALSKEPLILYNIGLAYEALGEHALAIEHFRAWRKHAPVEEHADLDRRIAELEEKVPVSKSPEEVPEPKPVAAEPAAASPPPRDEPSDAIAVAGLSLLGIGTTAVVAGIVIDVVAATNRPAEEEACVVDGSRLLCREELRTEIENANTLAVAGDVTWIAGAAVAATGLLMVLLAPDESVSDGVAIAAHASPEGGSVVIVAPF